MKQVTAICVLLLLGALTMSAIMHPQSDKSSQSKVKVKEGEMWISGSDCAGVDTYYAHVDGGSAPYTYEWKVVHGTTNVSNVGAYSDADHILLGTSPDDYIYLRVWDSNGTLMGNGWDGMWINDCSR